ncbi:reverse transcriptase domain-containing protein [Tanacetum coccineum]
MHAGPRSVVSKITKLGYYWTSIHNDAKALIQRCEACQIHSSIPRKPYQEMTPIMSAWPFSQWDRHCKTIANSTEGVSLVFSKLLPQSTTPRQMDMSKSSIETLSKERKKGWESPTEDGYMNCNRYYRHTGQP